MHVLSQALAVELGFLVIGAVILWAIAGPKRNLGRAFDLACVAALPLVFVDLVATVLVRAFALEVPRELSLVLTALGFAWAGAIIALGCATGAARSATVPPPPAEAVVPAKRAGWAILAVAAVGVVVQVVWISQHLDLDAADDRGRARASVRAAVDRAARRARRRRRRSRRAGARSRCSTSGRPGAVRA